MSKSEDYQAKADEMLVQLEAATSEGERTRLRRARGAYLRLVTHSAEAEAGGAPSRPEPRIVPEKPAAAAPKMGGWSMR